MRILVISPCYPPSPAGEAEHCRQIAERLASAGHRVDVLTRVHAMPAAASGFELHAVMTAWRWRDAPVLQHHIRRLRPDAVLLLYTAWLYDDHPMVSYLATWLRRWRPAVRVLTLVELPFPASPGTLAVRLGRRVAAWWSGGGDVGCGFGTLLRDSTSLAVLGPSVLADLSRHSRGLARRALVIPPPPLVRLPADRSEITRQAQRARLGVGPGSLLLAFFGYAYAGKGIETLLLALARLRRQGRDVRLVMAGGGRGLAGGVSAAHAAFEAKLQRLAAEVGVADAIVWPDGQSADSEALGLDLMAADLAVLPFDEGAELRRSSIAAVTALGLPLVTTTPAGPEPRFVHDQNCWLCPPRDAAALAAAVLAVADDTARRLRLREGALQLAHEVFSWSRVTAALLDALVPPETPAARPSSWFADLVPSPSLPGDRSIAP